MLKVQRKMQSPSLPPPLSLPSLSYLIFLLKRQGIISFIGSVIGSPWGSVPVARFCSTLHTSLMPSRYSFRHWSTSVMWREYCRREGGGGGAHRIFNKQYWGPQQCICTVCIYLYRTESYEYCVKERYLIMRNGGWDKCYLVLIEYWHVPHSHPPVLLLTCPPCSRYHCMCIN